jgi:dienelactone hydrolase
VWTADDALLFADDPSGRWNVWRMRLTADLPHEPVAEVDADTGGPLWVLGTRWFAALEDGRIVAVRTNGADALVLIGTDGAAHDLPTEAVTRLSIEDVRGTRLLLSGAGSRGAGLWEIDVDSPDARRLIVGGESPWGDEWMPRSHAVTFPGPHGPVHAFDYPPRNPEARGPQDERPPYVVFVHGGPTDHVGGAASGKIAYLTSRGIGVLDVNYGGSTGYGRAYRERLLGQWGVVDVDDVVAAARGHAAAGAADPERLAIAGGSAGGWTVLCALTGSDVFGAGISRYGVADLRRLAEDTHDFEASYLDGMVGPLPDAEHLYVRRSPLSHLDRLRTPLLIEQGLEDRVVPPSQSEAVRDALAANGVPHAYLAFEGEGHGFRGAETQVRTLEAEVAFLGQVFGFETPGIPPLSLD